MGSMGVRSVLHDKRPDLVLSGVNRGQNVAEDVTYSGTIAGAMEGTILGVPSVALSQAYGAVSGRFNPHWDCAETHAARPARCGCWLDRVSRDRGRRRASRTRIRRPAAPRRTSRPRASPGLRKMGSRPAQHPGKARMRGSPRRRAEASLGYSVCLPNRPARSWTYCQAVRPDRAPRVVAHSSDSARSLSGSISRPKRSA